MTPGESLARGRVVCMRTTVLTPDALATLGALSELNVRDVPSACVEVAHRIGRTPAAARFHLGRLWGAGLVVMGTVRLTVDGRCLANGRRAA